MARDSFGFDPEEFSDELTLGEDADPTAWPPMEAEVEFKFHGPEPDVGIFGNQLEVVQWTFSFGDVKCSSEEAFVAIVYNAICDQIEDDEATIARVIAAQIKVWEGGLEESEPDYPEPDYD